MPVTNYVWDPRSDNVLMETDGVGAVTAQYTHQPAEFGELISQHRNGQTYYHHFDGQGSTRAVTDESEDVVESATYSAFGELVNKSTTIINPFGFVGALGYYANPQTDDLYVRARTLESTLGRWLSADPLGAIDGPHLYSYARNHPLRYYDPSGAAVLEDALDCACAVIEYWDVLPAWMSNKPVSRTIGCLDCLCNIKNIGNAPPPSQWIQMTCTFFECEADCRRGVDVGVVGEMLQTVIEWASQTGGFGGSLMARLQACCRTCKRLPLNGCVPMFPIMNSVLLCAYCQALTRIKIKGKPLC